nr:caspase recruitment domain-containing protein 19 isoform X5 [Mirounga angustirostris]
MSLQGPGGHAVCGVGDLLSRPPPQPCRLMPSMLPAVSEQTYCDRLVQDTPFLMGQGSLSEQQVDRIVLQLNRYYPQILSNKDAEKFRNPKASLRVRLCDLLGHLQRSGERDCQEFYRALYIHAQLLHSRLPSRLSPRPVAFLACLGLAAGLALLVYCGPPGTSAASCWPSSQTTWEGSDAPARPPGGLPLLF